MRLFLYGTLMDPRALARLGGRPLASLPVPAILQGHRRVRLRGTRYLTIRRAPGYSVEGVLTDVGAETMRRLVAYEGERYRRIRLRVQTDHGIVRATCFYGDAPLQNEWRSGR